MKIFFTILISSLFLTFSQAQNEKNDEKVRIIKFGDSVVEDENEKEVFNKMAIKFSPTSFIIGNFPLEFERELTELFSVQVGIGLTFKPGTRYWGDFLHELHFPQFCNNDEVEGPNYCDHPYEYTFRTGKLGYFMSLSGKIFFRQKGFKGRYVAPFFRYSTRNATIQKVEEGQPYDEVRLDEVEKEFARNTDFLVRYGIQNYNEKMIWDFFFGLGLRSQNRTRQDLTYDSNQNLVNGTRNLNKLKLRGDLGVRIGLRL